MMQSISFESLTDKDIQEGPLVIYANVAGHRIRRIHVDGGSGAEIMFEHCFERLDEDLKARLVPDHLPLVGFSGERVLPVGKVTLPVTLGEGDKFHTVNLTFSIVRANSKNNIIMGRPGIKAFRGVVSTNHGIMKFPTPKGIASVSTAAEIIAALDRTKYNIDKEEEVWMMNGDLIEQTIKVGARLSNKVKTELKELLICNMDVFAWQEADMEGIPRDLVEHKLNIHPTAAPIRQKRRSMGPERRKAACTETKKLLQAGIVREVKYPSWIANPVMVAKRDGSWRMCIDFKDLNRATPKDCYPLPEMELKVEALTDFPIRCFLDAYKGYHQIQMDPEDEEKTAFYTDEGVFCYTKMPFGLNNAGATYQRFMDQTFAKQIGKNLEVYVDDLVIKSTTEEGMIKDVEKTFKTLRRAGMKLNPKKCSFGVAEGKFLGVMVTREGIRPNPENVEAIAKMPSPRTLKEVQKLNGRFVALNRFLSRMADRSLPFMGTLKNCLKKNDFAWTAEAEAAFQDMKVHLCNLPALTAPKPEETLIMYLAASTSVVSAVLMTERKEVQTPIYFVSRMLKDPETRYPDLEKLTLALVYASRRLRRYFQAHPIKVLTDQPIQKILRKPEFSGRLATWAIELGDHQITYCPRTAFKGQVIADFLAELPGTQRGEMDVSEGKDEEAEKREPWKLFTDGASNDEGCGACLILISPEGMELTYALRLNFKSTNNEAEYEALLAGLRIAKEMKIAWIEAHVDSMLVANQVNNVYEVKGEVMKQYRAKVEELMTDFEHCTIRHIPRSQNKKADALSKLASVAFSHLAKEIRVKILAEPSTTEKKVESIEAREERTRMSPLLDFLKGGILPSDQKEARKVQYKALNYAVEDEQLYRKSYLGPMLNCVDLDEANYIIRELHEGICGMNSGPKAVVARAMRAGYYWPGMYKTAVDEIQKCGNCQRHAPVSRHPCMNLISVTSAWPFCKWAIDIVGPFPEAAGRVKFLIVAIDYFTKWIEAKPLATITGQQVQRFVWENIVCRFGLPKELVSDNGKQFAENPFKGWCAELQIKQVFSSVKHPQSNGQVERANRSLVEGIKNRLKPKSHAWVEEVPHVLWTHRTTPKTSHGETPFSLTYGTEAMILTEIRSPSQRVQISEAENETDLRLHLNLLEERREMAIARETKYKKKVEKYYNGRVKNRSFKTGEWVLRDNEASLQEDTGKLGPKWEGPYQVIEANTRGSYKLAKPDGTPIPRTWHGMQLRKYFM
ncbi:hypothetical protein L1987_07661 [Smallanthus sonchifolius]|uniref:Uncharacterized protein n=1 Tax=Smallanthus sonchifolius TaxID=185202 RepID=A0ACB9K144_9ASTR|nr:hypothetical protein L1987_07661 [Smallanthus sonchifolius]